MSAFGLRLALAAAAAAVTASKGAKPAHHGAATSEVTSVDPHPLGPHEQYLAPYVDRLAEVRDSAIGRRYIFLANLVDVLPAWLEDWFVPLFLPHSTLRIPIGKKIPIHIPFLPTELEIVDLSISDLNKWTVIKPAKLLDTGKFTWASHMALKETTITLNAKLDIHGVEATARFTMPSTGFDFQAEVVVALEHSRVCQVWGSTMRSSADCALQAFFANQTEGVSGLNVTKLQVSLADFDLNVEVLGLGALGADVAQALDGALRGAKAEILANLPGPLSEGLRDIANFGILRSISSLHETEACPVSTIPANGGWEKVVNVSRVCINNNGAFALEFNFANCPTHAISHETGAFPADVNKCMNVEDVLPGVKEGDILRVQTLAIAGIHEIIDPAFRFVRNSNAAAFECSGSTLSYQCDFLSVVPVSPSALPQVSNVCVLNQAGFMLYFTSMDARTHVLAGKSKTYAANSRDCMSLGRANGAIEGDKFSITVQAIAGKRTTLSHQLEYRNNNMTATFMCKGSTMVYDCQLLMLAPAGQAESSAVEDSASEVQIVV